jgi:hypothetical protein
LKTLRLDANKDFANQLGYYRKMMNISLIEMSRRCGFHSSNIHHFENKGKPGAPYTSDKNALTETALKYAKALGATKIEITL